MGTDGTFLVNARRTRNVPHVLNKKAGVGHNLGRWTVRTLPMLNKLRKFGDYLFYKPLYRTRKQKVLRGANVCGAIAIVQAIQPSLCEPESW